MYISKATQIKLILQKFIVFVCLPLIYFSYWIFIFFIQKYKIPEIKKLRQQFKLITAQIGKDPLLICPNHLTYIDSVLLILTFKSCGEYLKKFHTFVWNFPKTSNVKHNWGYLLIGYLSKCVFIELEQAANNHNNVNNNQDSNNQDSNNQGSNNRGSNNRGSNNQVNHNKINNDKVSNQKKLYQDKPIDIAAYFLSKGDYIMLFPEGHRSIDGKVDLKNFAYGVGKLVKELPNIKVLCVYLRGSTQKCRSKFPNKHDTFYCQMALIDPLQVNLNLVNANYYNNNHHHNIYNHNNLHPINEKDAPKFIKTSTLRATRNIAKNIMTYLALMEKNYFSSLGDQDKLQ